MEIDMLVLCSPLLSDKVKDIFHYLGHETLCVPLCKSLDTPVCSHPDMLFFALKGGVLLTDRAYKEGNAEFFSRLEEIVEVRVSGEALAPKYPRDILFDAARNGDILFGRLEYTASEILAEHAVRKDVKQGYARCSTLMLENGAISADKGLCKSFAGCSLDVLNVSEGGIALPGYDRGFIGGASAVLERDKTVVFFGDVTRHPDGEKITAFCKEHGYEVMFPKGEELCDNGSVQTVSAEL